MSLYTEKTVLCTYGRGRDLLGINSYSTLSIRFTCCRRKMVQCRVLVYYNTAKCCLTFCATSMIMILTPGNAAVHHVSCRNAHLYNFIFINSSTYSLLVTLRKHLRLFKPSTLYNATRSRPTIHSDLASRIPHLVPIFYFRELKKIWHYCFHQVLKYRKIG